MIPDRNLPATSSTFNPGSSDALAAVPDLFAHLTAIFGATQMGALYGDADHALVRAEWAEGLRGFSEDEVRRGVAAMRLRKFAPNLGEFLQACRPSLDAEIAWFEAVDGMTAHDRGESFRWSHPAVFWAARGMRNALRETSFAASRRRWEAAMQAQWAAGAWAQPTQPQRKLPAAQAQEHLAGVPTMRAEVRDRLQRTRAAAIERMAANALRMADQAPVQVDRETPDFDETELAQRKDAAALTVLDALIAQMRQTGAGDSSEWRDSVLLKLRDVSNLPRERIVARLRATWPDFFGRVA